MSPQESFVDWALGQVNVTYCLTGVATLISLYAAWKITKRGKKVGCSTPPDTVCLYQLQRGTYAPSLSPFPVKLETFLRLKKIPYMNDLSQKLSSKGKTPWIAYNGDEIADSQLCINYLREKLNLSMDIHLSPEQAGVARAIQVMVDEHMYWCLVYFRWSHDPVNAVIRDHIPPAIPSFAASLLLWFFKRKVREQLHSQGLGTHSKDDILNFLKDDLTALNNYLGKKSFMMGEDLHPVDCSVFGHLCQLCYMQ